MDSLSIIYRLFINNYRLFMDSLSIITILDDLWFTKIPQAQKSTFLSTKIYESNLKIVYFRHLFEVENIANSQNTSRSIR